MSRPGVIFDVDGTLVDTNYHHAVAWWRAFQDHGIDLPVTRLHRHIGMGGDMLLDTLAPGADHAALEVAHTRHFDPFWAELRPLAGAARLLREVSARGGAVVLGTSAKPPELERLRAVIGADDAIDSATSAGEVAHSKPAPDVFSRALESAGLDPARAVAVGDTLWDVAAARGAGLRCICVETGGIAAAQLRDAGAAAVYGDCAELLREFDRSLLGDLLPESGR